MRECRACERRRKRVWRGWCRDCVEEGMSMVQGYHVWTEAVRGGEDSDYCRTDITIGMLAEKD